MKILNIMIYDNKHEILDWDKFNHLKFKIDFISLRRIEYYNDILFINEIHCK